MGYRNGLLESFQCNHLRKEIICICANNRQLYIDKSTWLLFDDNIHIVVQIRVMAESKNNPRHSQLSVVKPRTPRKNHQLLLQAKARFSM